MLKIEKTDEMRTILTDEEYDDYINQLARLPPRKRARWQKVIHGRRDTTILLCIDGELVDFTRRGYQKVLPARDLDWSKGEYPDEEARLYTEELMIKDPHERAVAREKRYGKN